MVSTLRSRTPREEEANRVAIGGHEKEGDFSGKVYKKQKTFKPYTFFLKRRNNKR
jgi:hypothetical protein